MHKYKVHREVTWKWRRQCVFVLKNKKKTSTYTYICTLIKKLGNMWPEQRNNALLFIYNLLVLLSVSAEWHQVRAGALKCIGEAWLGFIINIIKQTDIINTQGSISKVFFRRCQIWVSVECVKSKLLSFQKGSLFCLPEDEFSFFYTRSMGQWRPGNCVMQFYLIH